MTNDEIKTLALSCGFTERPQENGEMDLNPYVYEFARKCELKGMIEGITRARTALRNSNADFYAYTLGLKIDLQEKLDGVNDENTD